MIETATAYVFQTPEGGWRVVGTRVSLDSIVHCYWEGMSPESIVSEFPSLTAEKVFGAIAFYLHNRGAIDEYLKQQDLLWEQEKAESELKNAALLQRLRAAREARNSAGST